MKSGRARLRSFLSLKRFSATCRNAASYGLDCSSKWIQYLSKPTFLQLFRPQPRAGQGHWLGTGAAPTGYNIARTAQAWQTACQTGEPYEIEYRFKSIEGHYRWFLTRAVPHKNEQGEILYWYGTNTDIDEKKRLEEALKRANTDLDSFVHMASHDLKAPVINIEGLLKVLVQKLGPTLTQDTLQITDILFHSLQKLKQTLQDLATVSEANQRLDSLEGVSFAEVIEDVLTDLSSQLKLTGAKVDMDLSVAHICFPRKHLRSIFYNLLSNALKYRSPERTPHIGVAIQEVKEGILLKVTDNGVGLSEAQLAKLFTLFTRFHPQVEGSGVGLYLIKRIIENYKGQITVESKQGIGTTFCIVFAI